MEQSKIIILLGPGGVGKTTTGKVLAEKIGYAFVDLDQSFCDKIENIGTYIKKNGYADYCIKNSFLFKKLKKAIIKNTVIVLSSGFLAHEGLNDIVLANYQEIKNYGTKILLLPSENMELSKKIVVSRQLKRGFGLNKTKEELKFQSRYQIYLKYDYDLIIFSYESPEKITEQIIFKLDKKLII
ncbi:MAG: shikimate kinase [Patescibacteria group bacterium]|jgi:shikimate kinase